MRSHRERQAAYRERQLEQNPEAFAARAQRGTSKWREKNPEKNAAHCRVYRAVRNGTLVRPDRCERCDKECKPEASHDDYAKPLEVEWLCRPCHVRKDWFDE